MTLKNAKNDVILKRKKRKKTFWGVRKNEKHFINNHMI